MARLLEDAALDGAVHDLPALDAYAYERRLAVAVLCDDIAHELASPLTYLRDLVLHGAESLDPTDVSIGREEIARLESVVAHLRRTRRPEVPLSVVAVRPIVARVAARLRAEQRRELPLALDVPGDLRANASEPGLELLLLVLARNAITAATPDGIVRIRAGRDRASQDRDGDEAFVEIVDDGPGLSKPRAETLFHPLTTLGRGGAGTGLPIALRIAREHAFRLTYRRAEGHTVFRVGWDEPACPRGDR
jgi:signal transduction histidine kinase